MSPCFTLKSGPDADADAERSEDYSVFMSIVEGVQSVLLSVPLVH